MFTQILKILPLSLCALYISHFLPLSSKATNNIFYLGIALPGMMFLLLQTKQTIITHMQKLFLPLALLGCIVAISAEHLRDAKVILYLFFLATAATASSDGLSSVHKGLWLASLVNMILLFGISIHWAMLSIQADTSIRYAQLFGMSINPVHIALLMSTSLGYVWIFHAEARLQRYGMLSYAAGFLACIAVALLISSIFQARSALMGLGLFFATYVYQRQTNAWLIASLIALGVAVALFFGIDDTLTNRGLSYRPAIWEDALRRLTEDCGLLLGCGKNDGYLFAGRFPHPHSGYISVLYQSGILGLSAFVLFTGVFLFRALRRDSPWLPIAMIGWGALITTSNGMFTSPSHPLWIYFWLPTIMCLIQFPNEPSDLPTRKKT